MAGSFEGDNRPIGVFDSGLGGLTAIKQLELLLPHEDMIYFGDTGRVPYGTKSRAIINKYTAQVIRFLKSHNVKAILAACGTVSSVAGDVGAKSGLPFFDVLDATCDAAADITGNGKIGVIGTSTTIASGAYKRNLLNRSPDLTVYEQACPMFVPLVENGYISPDDEVCRLVAQQSLLPVKEKEIDTLILGCTHFPIIAPVISDIMGDGVALVDSGKQAAMALARCLEEKGMLKSSPSPSRKSFFVSDTPEGFSGIAQIFLGHSIKGTTVQVDIEKY